MGDSSPVVVGSGCDGATANVWSSEGSSTCAGTTKLSKEPWNLQLGFGQDVDQLWGQFGVLFVRAKINGKDIKFLFKTKLAGDGQHNRKKKKKKEMIVTAGCTFGEFDGSEAIRFREGLSDESFRVVYVGRARNSRLTTTKTRMKWRGGKI